MKVALKEIIFALEMQFDEQHNYLDRQTGEVELVSDYVKRLVEGNGSADELPEWQLHEFEIVTALFEDPDRFEKLPTAYDIHEWEIMREFAEAVEPAQLRIDLLNAIRGKGAFRYFKDTLWRYGREKDWFAFREAALRDIAIEWCEENGIEYTEP